MTVYVVSAGVVSSGLVLQAGDTASVLAVGVTVSTSDLGLEQVFSGGYASATTIGSGGRQLVFSGGLARATAVSSGGVMALASGAVADGILVDSGGVVSGAETLSGFIDDYGLVSGGVLQPGTVSTPGRLVVESGGVASSVTASASQFGQSTQVEVMSGGVAVGTVIDNGANPDPLAILNVDAGGVVSNTLLVNGATMSLGGTAYGTTEQGGGMAVVLSGGVAIGATLSGNLASAGAFEIVASGGVASGATVLAAGILDLAGGSASNVTVGSGGQFYLGQGASASNVTVSSGGVANLFEVVSSGQVLDYPQQASGMVVSGVTIEAGATINLIGLAILSGGTVVIASGATLNGGVTVSAGGVLSGPGVAGTIIDDSGLVAGVPLVSGAQLRIHSGGVASGVAEDAASIIEVFAGGSAVATLVKGGFTVDAGGVASGTVLSQGSASILGTDSGTLVESGATEIIQAGGDSMGATVLSGGTEVLDPGGAVSALTVFAGATLHLPFVSATSAAVSRAGQLVVTSNGVVVDRIGLAGAFAGLGFSVGSDGNFGAVISVTSSTTPPAATVGDDFNGDGLSDLVWRNSNGDAGIWLTSATGGYTPIDFGVIDNSWQIAGVGDFNGDGKADILWRNSNGQVGEWLSKPGAGYNGFTAPILATIDPSWQIQGVGDFNGDGLSDIVWRNTNGDAGIWLTTAAGGYTPIDFGIIDNNWQVQGVGDFNGDRKADILWRNNATGQVGEWLSNAGTGYAGFTTPILATIDPSWQIQAVGDFSADGLSDIVWRNTNGDTGIWITTAGGGYTVVDLGVVESSWTIQGVGDFNGDGKADILWRNANGAVGEWLSNPGAGFTGFTKPILANIDPSWVIQGKAPALQGAPGQSATAFANVMASMGAHHGASPAIAAPASATPILLAMPPP